ncbi:MAG: succinate dehydrogenase iron-sulfur subunit [Hyphomicrobiaceae bacterium]
MVALMLPANSRVEQGRQWNDRGGTDWVEFQVYRWHPETQDNPRLDSYWVDRSQCGPMVLDALIKIKNEIDPTLAFRRSCREGICGSCSMNIDGRNALACQRNIEQGVGPIHIYPLPHMRVIRDLVPDLSQFFEHYHRTEPWLQTESATPDHERLQGRDDRAKLDGLYECILCACCSAACPSYWWNSDVFPGPAALLQTHRWVRDSRDENAPERVARSAEPSGIWGCRQILNCAKACPKGLNPARSIAELRKLQLGWTRRS